MKTLAITSGKGGVGKSTLSANLAVALAQDGVRTLLFDADFGLANLDVFMGVKPNLCQYDVLKGNATLREVTIDCPSGVSLVPGGTALPLLTSIGPKRYQAMLDQMHEMSDDFDIALFDTGAGIGRQVINVAASADSTLIVTTPDPASLLDAYAAVKTIFRKNPDATMYVLVNQVTNPSDGERHFRVLDKIASEFVQAKLQYVGAVRRDPTVSGWLAKRTPAVIGDPNGVVVQDVRRLAAAIWSLVSEGKTAVKAA